MKSSRVVSLACVAAALSAGAAAQAVEYGTIVSSTPVIGQSSVPQRECHDEQVTVQQRTGGGGAVVGAVLGGLVGNSVGAGMGRAAATAVGVVAGAAIGDRVEANSQPQAVQNVQRCRTVSTVQENIIGYDVVYDYNGARRTARLAQNPGGPGAQIALDVSVSPSGSARPYRQGQPVPPSAGQPVGEPVDAQPQTLYEERRPVVYPQTVYYQPAPVYYTPYPAVVASPTIWVGGSWGVRRRHW